MDPQSIVNVLAEIAETASESLELQEVFNRVAAAVHRLIPFDHMGVVRIIEGRFAVLHATTADCRADDRACTGPEPLSSWSPRWRPRPGAIVRIDDAEAELDRSFPMDDRILQAGVRSALWEPFRPADSFLGGVFLSSFTPRTFTPGHQEILRPIAALLGSGVEHWRIWDAERRNRARLDQLESLLGTLAESLDIREVFDRISETVQPVLPHDLVVLTELDPGARTFRVAAVSGQADIEAPRETIALSPLESARRLVDHEIYRDIPEDIRPDTERNRLLISTGMRSWIRVPVRTAGEVHGMIGFFHREPSRFGPEDVEIVRRIADRIALVLSHQALAEKARLAAEARERAERLAATIEVLTRELEAQGRHRVVGVSRSWRDVLQQVGRVAPSETTVLITGESGTGKEVVSRLIHEGSPRAAKPFVAINCAALPDQLLESELFGHEKGSFTGAIATKIGRLEQAAGGTLFLDEIAEMSPVVQAKFLRLLQEREFQRVGGTRVLAADVRVVAATNRDLAVAIARGQFREDLFYRLNVFEIDIPPLRARTDDILPLAEAFLEDLGRTMGRPAAGISRDAREWLLGHPWPGNVRELRNAIERAILLCDGGLISREHLPAVISRPDRPRATPGNGAAQAPFRDGAVGSADAAPFAPAGISPPASTFAPPGATRLAPPFAPSDASSIAPATPAGVQIETLERSLVERALRDARGNKSRAARLLGLTRSQLYSRLQKYGIQ